MELTLKHQTGTQISVICDEQISHAFDLSSLLLKDEEEFLKNPKIYGKKFYEALFPQNSLTQRALAILPSRLLLVTTDDDLDAIPWEYTYGPNGFLILEYPFIRGLPAGQRVASLAPPGNLHIIAVPSNPLSRDEVKPLNVEDEWMRLKEVIQDAPSAITLERTHPPTLTRVRELVANQKGCVVHFMGHGEQNEHEALLCFEKENGSLDWVTTKLFMQRVRNNAFLVTLNACASAKPGPTSFSNLAASLVRQQIPYALGMRLNIDDKHASIFSRTFYSELARGTSVEEAVFQTRLTLSQDKLNTWVIGVPVLYTSLADPAIGFTSTEGQTTIKEHQPPIESSLLPRAEGTFQGRSDELIQLGTYLTGNNRKRLVTIHGGGGQGKTALAREAVERFAYAWPGGVWATTLEHLPGRTTFVTDLARFLAIPIQEIPDLKEIEQRVFALLKLHRTLIVLDNAETLIEAVEKKDEMALQLANLIQQLPQSSVTLLVTSRMQLGWSEEETLELGGLTPEKGALLFQQWTPQRKAEVLFEQAQQLSKKLEGHPLSLRLLAGAFNETKLPLSSFLTTYEDKLIEAENKFGLEQRHRKLYACIETSVRYLEPNLRALLSGLWIFHTPFLVQAAVDIFDPETEETEQILSPIRDRLHLLWQRGLLTYTSKTTREETLQFYHLLPTTRPYVEQYMESVYQHETLLKSFGTTYGKLATSLYTTLDASTTAITIVQQCREDFERGMEYVTDIEQGQYLLSWGRIEYRLGNSQKGLELLECALKIAKDRDELLEAHIANSIAASYLREGQPQEALRLFKQALLFMQKVGNRTNEGTVLASIGTVYEKLGQKQEALHWYEQALPVLREVGYRSGEATTLYSMAAVYFAIGQSQKAYDLLQQALLITQEIGDRANEAACINNIGSFYRSTGELRKALSTFQEALSITQDVDINDPALEATTLNNIALTYLKLGEPQEALKQYEQQVLPLTQKIGDRAGEVNVLNNIGTVYMRISQTQEALKYFGQVLPIAQNISYRVGEATALNNIGQTYAQMSQFQEALEAFEQALPIIQDVGDRALEATILNNVAGIYKSIGQRKESAQYYEHALSISQEINDQDGKAHTLNNIGELYRGTGRLQEALEHFEQAQAIMQAGENLSGEATVLANIGLIYTQTGQTQKALEAFEQALSVHKRVGDRSGEASTLNSMGEIHRILGQPQEALTLLEQSLAIRQEINDREGKAATILNIGMLYRSIGQPQEALKHFEQAQVIAQAIGARDGEAVALNNIGLIYQDTGLPQKALSMYEQALPITREIEDRATEATVLNNIAGVHQSLGQTQEAIQYYEQALPIMKIVGYQAGEAMLYNNIGQIYLKTGQPKEAIDLFQKALLIIREVGNRTTEAAILSNIATAYVTLGQSQDALPLYKQSLTILQETGDRGSEVTALYGIAYLYQTTQHYTEALTHFEMCIKLAQETNNSAIEIAGLTMMANLLHQHFDRTDEALSSVERALTLFKETGLPQDAAGNTPKIVQSLLQRIQRTNALHNDEKQDQQVVTKAIQTVQKFFKRPKHE